MPRAATRRKLPTDENNEAPKPKLQRVMFEMPVPTRSQITGRVLVCGQGDMGQLGLGNDDSKFERKRPALVEQLLDVVDVCAGGMHNLVLTSEGQIYSFGCNDEGALGRDSSEEGSEFEPLLVDLPGPAVRISCGDSHSACLLEDGSVYAWGSFRDSHGNMGLTLEGNKRLPINVLPSIQCCDISSGSDHLVILTCAGKVYTVGCGQQGQLGRVSGRSATGESRRGKTELLRPALVTLKRAKTIDAIWASTFCTFLRDSQTKAIWAFGLNNYKQLGYGKDINSVMTPALTDFQDVKEIAGGQHHTLVLKADGSCYVIGRHDYGRLGLGKLAEDLTEVTVVSALEGKTIVKIACGDTQSFALTAEGGLYSWGMGSNLQLGTGSDDDALEPVLIVSKQTEGKSIIQASSGGQHSIFLVKNEHQAKDTKAAKPIKKQQDKSVKPSASDTSNGAATESDTQIVDDPMEPAAKPSKATKATKKPQAAAAPQPDKAVKSSGSKTKNGTANEPDKQIDDDDDTKEPTPKVSKTSKASTKKQTADKVEKPAASKTSLGEATESDNQMEDGDDSKEPQNAAVTDDDVSGASGRNSAADIAPAKRGRKKK